MIATLARVGVIVVLVVAAVWLALVVPAAVFQRQLIHLPDTSVPPLPDGVDEVMLTTSDGLRLTAWFVPSTHPVATVLLAPGNAGNRGARLDQARALSQRGFSVLLVDYRGYGGNPGSPSEAGMLDDLRAAVAHLQDRDDVDPERIVYYGESLGTAVAAALAVEHPPVAVVLRSPFPELADVGQVAYPYLPVRTLLRDRFHTQEYLGSYDGPVLVIAGSQDTLVPTELSIEVAQRAGATLVLVEGANHNDAALFVGQELLDAVTAHVHEALGAS